MNTLNNTEIKLEVLDPVKANVWISKLHPTRQRKAKPNKVSTYAEDMDSGNWMDEGTPFRFDENGYMIDGQHRCLAVIKSGMTIPFPVIVIRNVQEAAIQKIDRGATRSMRDILKIATGSSRHSKAGEIAAFKLRVIEGRRAVTDTEIVNKTLGTPSYLWVVEALPESVRGVTIASVKLALAEMWERDHVKASSFAKSLVDGAGLDYGNPVLTLRNYLLNNKPTASNRAETYKKTVSACKAYLEGKSRSKLYAQDWQ